MITIIENFVNWIDIVSVLNWYLYRPNNHLIKKCHVTTENTSFSSRNSFNNSGLSNIFLNLSPALSGDFQHACDKMLFNTCAMVCDVYFSFSKIFLFIIFVILWIKTKLIKIWDYRYWSPERGSSGSLVCVV